ncbi:MULTISPECIES: poly(ethylene terephthalate) hydrolase family protein [unclassified Rhodococcus (in: high G+C Gram-positive bacteria)]|uniref:poly(ethylene terephthalate) hydrolase family protein n=1 Tax=unclassified Rhodococcus (in: high G+C Gram-positive bacteria) TaxID=192944 RepID=UPI000E0B0483|nr:MULTISPECIES: hypothetical protein [unclassified Rhodococcus (in: high G+C Gram-positive bacteria)]QKT12049.1 hypothetical protein HUN07_16225 [Rhodococcus sp. W8901]RDI32592.1 hypothetical protein DEU38_103328 [Rhodococcus sp. AG1013]
MTRRLRKSLVVLVTAITAVVAAGTTAQAGGIPTSAAGPTKAVESTYSDRGPWELTTQKGFGCCDSTGAAFDVWYPTDLGANGERHPIITWGNGTFAHPHQYDYLLSHLASWGFVVIAADNTNTGSGREMLEAVDFLRRQDGDPSSVFHQKLDTDAVGAMGHSQGAVGTLNATAHSGGTVRTAVPIELPGQYMCTLGLPKPEGMTTCTDPRELTTGSVFYVNGSDSPISASTQPLPWQMIGIQSAQAYYEATPESLTKVRATLNGPNHNDIQGQPGCTPDNLGCVNGVTGFLGYLTAWVMDRLQGDTRAHSAFVSGTGELFGDPDWSNQTSNITG